DATISSGLPYGGWCPKGRIDETGKIPAKYIHLQEIAGKFKNDKENYDARTKQNIQDADATLIIVPELPLSEKIQDGTRIMFDEVARKKKPYLVVDLSKSKEVNSELIANWIKENKFNVLNIGGP